MHVALSALVLVWAIAVAPNEWRVEQGDVRVICPMTIGGSFEAKTTALSGSLARSTSGPHAFDGTLAVDLRTLETGIGLRDQHLRETYLEVDNGPAFGVATLSEIDVQGLDPDATSGKGSFAGSLTLHGLTRQVAGSVDIRQSRGGRHVRAVFPVRLPDYHVRKPRYLGVGVKDTVRVEVEFDLSS
jgi:polyisoprenoid-binding protein YceI